MKHGKPFIIAVATAAALVLLWPEPADTPPGQVDDGAPNDPLSHAPADAPVPIDLTPEQQALLEDPRIIQFAQRLDFEEELQRFFQEAAELDAQQRQDRADQLEQQLARYEQETQVSAPEALMVRLALLQLLEQDEAAAKAAATELIERYKARSEARLEAWRSAPKPEFVRYKVREKEIVEEVMALDRVPGGLTRDQYLRQRLLEARIETMGQPEPDSQSNWSSDQ